MKYYNNLPRFLLIIIPPVIYFVVLNILAEFILSDILIKILSNLRLSIKIFIKMLLVNISILILKKIIYLIIKVKRYEQLSNLFEIKCMFIFIFSIENGLILNTILRNELEDLIFVIINFVVMIIH